MPELEEGAIHGIVYCSTVLDIATSSATKIGTVPSVDTDRDTMKIQYTDVKELMRVWPHVACLYIEQYDCPYTRAISPYIILHMAK